MKRLIAFVSIMMLFIASAQAASVTVDIFGTNASNAYTNKTQSGNNSYNISTWGVGDATKSIRADINGNASDAITFTLHNMTAGRVVEVKVNGSSYNAYQADATGTISFTRTQTVRNQSYSFTPAVNAGGYNFTWAQIWNGGGIYNTNGSGCAFSTVYQNPNTTSQIVTIVTTTASGNSVLAKVDGGNPPITTRAYQAPSTALSSTTTFVVLPGEYWLLEVVASPTLSNCNKQWRS